MDNSMPDCTTRDRQEGENGAGSTTSLQTSANLDSASWKQRTKLSRLTTVDEIDDAAIRCIAITLERSKDSRVHYGDIYFTANGSTQQYKVKKKTNEKLE